MIATVGSFVLLWLTLSLIVTFAWCLAFPHMASFEHEDSESLEARRQLTVALSRAGAAGLSCPAAPAPILQSEPNGTHTRGNHPGLDARSDCIFDWSELPEVAQ